MANNPLIYNAALGGFLGGSNDRWLTSTDSATYVDIRNEAVNFANAVDLSIATDPTINQSQADLMQSICESVFNTRYPKGLPASAYQDVALAVRTLWSMAVFALIPIPTGAVVVDIQDFTTPGSTTWQKPTQPFHIAIVRVWAGGTGGAGGGGNAAGSTPAGGGGPGGGFDERTYLSTQLSNTEVVTVGGFGTAGPGVVTAGTSTSGVGGLSSFGPVLTPKAIAFPGGTSAGFGTAASGGGGGLIGPGVNAAASNNSGGQPRVGMATNLAENNPGFGGGSGANLNSPSVGCSVYGGGGGGPPNNGGPSAAPSGAVSLYGGGGGGGGGGVTNAGVRAAGGDGGKGGRASTGVSVGGGGTGAPTSAQQGGPGTDGDPELPSAGSGGGGGSAGALAGPLPNTGGIGGFPGGGGGGGGANDANGEGQPGGVGGGGRVWVKCIRFG